MAFPTGLTSAVDGVTEIIAAHLNNLEIKVGIDGSATATTLDYLLKNAASIEPGHKHSKLWANDGNPQAVWVDSVGNVGIGIDAFASSSVKNFGIGSGTAPDSAPADMVQLWVQDLASGAGDAALHIRTETSTIHVFGSKVGIGTAGPEYNFQVYGSNDGAVTINCKNMSTGTSAYTSISASNSNSMGGLFKYGINFAGWLTMAAEDTGIINFTAGHIVINNTVATGNIYISGGGLSVVTLRVLATDNVIIGTPTACGTSAAKVLGIGTGTAPSSAPADMIQIYSADGADANSVLCVYQEKAPSASTTNTVTNKIPVRWNGTVYYLLASTSGT